MERHILNNIIIRYLQRSLHLLLKSCRAHVLFLVN